MTLSLFTRRRGVWLAVAAVGLLALTARWLDRLRPLALDRRSVSEFHVTSGSDQGIGSLREAILAADRSNGRVRIVLDAPRIRVDTPLPPVINPMGVAIEAAGAAVTIDAAGVAGSVLDIAAADTVLSGFRLSNASAEAILIRRNGARIRHVTIDHAAVAVALAAGSDGLVVESSELDANGVGIQIADAVRRATVVNTQFRRHTKAAVWAVAAQAAPDDTTPNLIVRDSRFDRDNQPLVIINMHARVERNTIAGSRVAAMLISGGSIVVRENRVRSGIGFGIAADTLERGMIAGNEIDHNCAGGILVRSARNTQLVSNRLYANGYGIVMVLGTPAGPNTLVDNLIVHHFVDGLYVIGGSPLIRQNRVLDNRRAGVRVAALLLTGQSAIQADPLLSGNVVSGNEHDTLRDDFRPGAADLTPPDTAECSWRLSDDRQAVARQ